MDVAICATWANACTHSARTAPGGPGATLLVTGRFDEDPHFHATGRPSEIGLAYEPGPLTIREHLLKRPGGEARLVYAVDNETTFLDRAFLPDGSTRAEDDGKGEGRFYAFAAGVQRQRQAIGDVYRADFGVKPARSCFPRPAEREVVFRLAGSRPCRVAPHRDGWRHPGVLQLAATLTGGQAFV